MKEHLALLGELDKKQITTPMEYFLLEILILQLKYKSQLSFAMTAILRTDCKWL